MTKQVTISVKDAMDRFKKDMERLTSRMDDAVNQAVKETAYAAYASIQAKAQAELNSTRQDYLKGLDIEDLGNNSYLITLDGDWANRLEEGFASYNLTDVLLRSKKIVQVGRRSGQPWVQHTKDEHPHKFAYVPYERKPFAKGAKTADLAAAIREMQATGVNGIRQNITQIFKDAEGNPLEGKVAIGRSENSKLDGLVKYQKTYNKSGKGATQSVYIVYRAVSEAGKPWIHPGYKGAHFFEEAEKEVVRQLDNIIKAFT